MDSSASSHTTLVAPLTLLSLPALSFAALIASRSLDWIEPEPEPGVDDWREAVEGETGG